LILAHLPLVRLANTRLHQVAALANLVSLTANHVELVVSATGHIGEGDLLEFILESVSDTAGFDRAIDKLAHVDDVMRHDTILTLLVGKEAALEEVVQFARAAGCHLGVFLINPESGINFDIRIVLTACSGVQIDIKLDHIALIGVISISGKCHRVLDHAIVAHSRHDLTFIVVHVNLDATVDNYKAASLIMKDIITIASLQFTFSVDQLLHKRASILGVRVKEILAEKCAQAARLTGHVHTGGIVH